MNLDDLRKLESEIASHRGKARSFRSQAERIADLRRASDMPRAQVGDVRYEEAELDSSYQGRAKRYDKALADAAFQRAWERHGRNILRIAETDLLQQARQEQATADLLQARLDRILAAAGEVGGEQSEAEPAGAA